MFQSMTGARAAVLELTPSIIGGQALPAATGEVQ